MTFKLLVRKLALGKEKYIDSTLLKSYCKILGMDYYVAIRYLTHYKYLHRIFRGIFYKPSIEERKYKALSVNHLEALSAALKIKGIKNWYFGLETALKMNALTHEFFAIDTIMNDNINRPGHILGNKVLFLKIKPELLTFGIKKDNEFRYSDIEKTILDMIYLKRYKGTEDKFVLDSLRPYLKSYSKAKLKEYAKHYNKKIEAFVETL